MKSCRRSINRIGYKRARTSTQLSVYIAAYQCCKGKRKGQVHYYQKKVNANLIWIRHEHPVTFPLNSAECTIRWFIPVGFFFFFSFFLMLAMQTHRGKKQKQQIQLDLIPRYAPAQLFFFFFFLPSNHPNPFEAGPRLRTLPALGATRPQHPRSLTTCFKTPHPPPTPSRNQNALTPSGKRHLPAPSTAPNPRAAAGSGREPPNFPK